jgi:hypothetical protein
MGFFSRLRNKIRKPQAKAKERGGFAGAIPMPNQNIDFGIDFSKRRGSGGFRPGGDGQLIPVGSRPRLGFGLGNLLPRIKDEVPLAPVFAGVPIPQMVGQPQMLPQSISRVPVEENISEISTPSFAFPFISPTGRLPDSVRDNIMRNLRGIAGTLGQPNNMLPKMPMTPPPQIMPMQNRMIPRPEKFSQAFGMRVPMFRDGEEAVSDKESKDPKISGNPLDIRSSFSRKFKMDKSVLNEPYDLSGIARSLIRPKGGGYDLLEYDLTDFLNSSPKQRLFGVNVQLGNLMRQYEGAVFRKDAEEADRLSKKINELDAIRINIQNEMMPVPEMSNGGPIPETTVRAKRIDKKDEPNFVKTVETITAKLDDSLMDKDQQDILDSLSSKLKIQELIDSLSKGRTMSNIDLESISDILGSSKGMS